MTLAPGDTSTTLVVLLLSALFLGGLLVLLAGWSLGTRARYVAGGVAMLAVVGVVMLVVTSPFGWSRNLASLPPVSPEARASIPTRAALTGLLGSITMVAFALTNQRAYNLIDRVVIAVVTLLGTGLAIIPAIPGLLPVSDHDLSRETTRDLGQLGGMILFFGFLVVAFTPLTTYRLGLLVAMSSVTTSVALLNWRDPLPIVGIAAPELAFLVLALLGAALTLYGNLRHPAQWLAAGAGIAAVAGALYGQSSALLIAGVLAILFVPRLIGRYMGGGVE